MNEAAEGIRGAADPEANIIFGTVIDERMGDEVTITVIATGFDTARKPPGRAAGPPRVDSAASSAPRESATSARSRAQRDQVPPTAAPFPTTPDRTDGRHAAAVSARPRASRRRAASASERPATTYDAEDLEIPSFLRRK